MWHISTPYNACGDWQKAGSSFIYLSKDWFGHDPRYRHDTLEAIVLIQNTFSKEIAGLKFHLCITRC